MALRILLALLALAALPAPAAAQLRALAPDGAGPALSGDRVVWATRGEGVLHVSSAPAAGGEAVALGDVPARAREDAELDAAPSGVAVRLYDPRSRGRLFVAEAGGGFRPLAGNLADPPVGVSIPSLRLTPAGVFTLEGAAAWLRDGSGRAKEVALPPGADPERVAAGGGLGVAPTPEGALIVFDLRSDIERNQISLGRYDPYTINGLAVSPEGDVAATVPAGDGSDVLLWARAGASRVRVLARGLRYSAVATGGGRVALVGGDGLREGMRVSILDPATGQTVFRGPAASDVTALSFDGHTVAFATPGCRLAGPPVSRSTFPEGPCSRTDVAVAAADPAVRDGAYHVRVACLNGPARRCRVSARLTTRAGKIAGRVTTRLRTRAARVLAIPLSAPARGLGLTVEVTDPDGRTRLAYEGS